MPHASRTPAPFSRLLAWRLAYREYVRQAARALPGLLRHTEERFAAATGRLGGVASPVAWAIALALPVAGIRYGSRVAGGADAFGYLSEAALLGSGRLALDQSFAAALPWPHAAGSFVPLAYRLGANGVMGPTVAPGLPVLMAFAAALSACGPYLVVPLCGALLVLATYWLGRRLIGAGPALAAAALVACSPVVVFESLVVMADVPAAAFWISALAVAWQRTGVSTLGAGVLSGIAILIRPNLLPLAVFPWLFAICRVPDARVAGARTAIFALGSVPAALVIAFINQRIHGSAFTSGYGDLGTAFALQHGALNLRLYSGWWLESQGITGLLFVFALWPWRAGMRREVAILIAYALSGALLYLFYLPFDQWWYLRFMIPAIPIVLLLCAEAAAWLTRWSTGARAAALMALLVAGGTHAIQFVDSKDILTNADAEKRRYLDAAVYVDADAPIRSSGAGHAAQRQHPLLHRAPDDAMGCPRCRIARRSGRGAPRARRAGLCGDRVVGGGELQAPLRGSELDRAARLGSDGQIRRWRNAGLCAERRSGAGTPDRRHSAS